VKVESREFVLLHLQARVYILYFIVVNIVIISVYKWTGVASSEMIFEPSIVDSGLQTWLGAEGYGWRSRRPDRGKHVVSAWGTATVSADVLNIRDTIYGRRPVQYC
jgi:hypothetical protein